MHEYWGWGIWGGGALQSKAALLGWVSEGAFFLPFLQGEKLQLYATYAKDHHKLQAATTSLRTAGKVQIVECKAGV